MGCGKRRLEDLAEDCCDMAWLRKDGDGRLLLRNTRQQMKLVVRLIIIVTIFNIIRGLAVVKNKII